MAAQDKLPTPATAADMFQHAAVMELRRLNGNIEKLLDALVQPQPEPTGDEVTLREPKPEEPRKAAHRDAKASAEKAAETVADEAVGPVTVETKEPGKAATVEVVEPSRPAKASKRDGDRAE